MKNRKLIISICLSIIITATIAILFKGIFYREIVYYAFDDYSFLEKNPKNSKYSDKQIEDLSTVITNKGYEVIGAHQFNVLEEDPYLLYEVQNKIMNKVNVRFLEPLRENLELKVYVASEKDDFNENNSSSVICNSLSTICEVNFIEREVSRLRVDIGNDIATEFKLDKIEVMDAGVTYKSFKSIVKLELIFIICLFIIRKVIKYN